MQRNFPDLTPRIAAVNLSRSDTLEADDDLSKDHDWGPAFNLILTKTDYINWGEQLNKAINTDMPKIFMGYDVEGIYIYSIDLYFKKHIGVNYPPKHPQSWKSINETGLYWLKRIIVFHDQLGKWTGRRILFSKYPPHYQLQRIIDEMYGFWHYGEYNFQCRMVYRKDPVAIQICLGYFVQSAMRICFLLNGDFTPYWKWLHHEFLKQPDAKVLEPLLMKLVQSENIEEKASILWEICTYLRKRLVQCGFLNDENVCDLSQTINELRDRLKNQG